MEAPSFIDTKSPVKDHFDEALAKIGVLTEASRLFWDYAVERGLSEKEAFIAAEGVLSHYLDESESLGSKLALLVMYDVADAYEALHTCIMLALKLNDGASGEKDAVIDAAISSVVKRRDEEAALMIAASLSKSGENALLDKLITKAKGFVEIDPALLPQAELPKRNDEAGCPSEDSLGEFEPRTSSEGDCGVVGVSRSADRIPAFMEELGSLWAKHFPDWRFGQLLCNLDRFHRHQNGGADCFYMEELEFLALVSDFIETLRPGEHR